MDVDSTRHNTLDMGINSLNTKSVMNYYKAHPNKKPKKLPRKRTNYKRAHVTIIMAMNALQISSITSNVFKNNALKALEVANVVIQTAGQIQKLFR